LVSLALSSCGKTDLIRINYGGAADRERAFLKSALSPGALERLGLAEAAEAGRPPVDLQWFFTWNGEEAEEGTVLFPLSRTWYVPRGDPLEGRTDITLEDCLTGNGDLVPLKDLGPPYTALRVDGLAVDDPGYPLIKFTGARITLNGNAGAQRGLGKKALALREHVLKSLEAVPELFEELPALCRIASAGDLMLGRGAEEILFSEGPAGIFGGTAEFLRDADLALVNLEGAMSSRGTRVQKSFNFRFNPRAAAALRNAGIDAVLLANNHAFDYGEEAFLDSLAHLGNAGIGVLGAGLNEEEAAGPFTFQRGPRKAKVFGIASFPRERNGWDGLAAAAGTDKPGILHAGRGGGEKLKSLFSEDDTLDIVLFHGGVEWSRRPDRATRAFYTDLIEQGADLIIGSHPHMVQGFEWVRDKAVFWSLGNYVFNGMENTGGGEEGLFIRLGFLGTRLVYLEPYPLTLSHARTEIAPAGRPGAEQLDRFYALSRELRDHTAPEYGTAGKQG
jgi:poly-gamma-glutamate synthesis protein (capsule biosynthesis protein)